MVRIKSANTILYCKKWEAMVDFYQSMLGLKILFSKDWFIEFELSDSSRISIANEAKTSVKSSGGNGLTLTFEVDNLNEVHTSLLKSGANPDKITDHVWGAKVFYVYDPEGNRLEFWSSTNK